MSVDNSINSDHDNHNNNSDGNNDIEVEDFDHRLSEMGVSLKDRGSRKKITIMEVSNHG